MTTQKEALAALKNGNQLINGVICNPSNGVIQQGKGRLTKKQLTELEGKGAKSHKEGSVTIHKM